jgi:hypothetical protein
LGDHPFQQFYLILRQVVVEAYNSGAVIRQQLEIRLLQHLTMWQAAYSLQLLMALHKLEVRRLRRQ